MPKRPERFFWIRAEDVTSEVARAVDLATRDFVQAQGFCAANVHICTPLEASAKHLWLLRAATSEERIARAFKKSLGNHVDKLKDKLRISRLRRIPNLPTPLIAERLVRHSICTDIGLHVVNDNSNGMLVTYTYYEGRFHNPPHFQLSEARFVLDEIADRWNRITCDCKRSDCQDCHGFGCYSCFAAECPTCGGTGWANFSRWASGGYRIDYGSRFPLAVLDAAVAS